MQTNFSNSSITMREVIITLFYKYLTKKTYFSEGRSLFKFNNLGLALGMAFKFYTSVTKKLRAGKFGGLIPTFVEVTWENWRGAFLPPSSSTSPPCILKRVKVKWAQEARDNQFLFQNVQNKEIFEIFKMFKTNRWINVHYTKSKRLYFIVLVVLFCCTLFG